MFITGGHSILAHVPTRTQSLHNTTFITLCYHVDRRNA